VLADAMLVNQTLKGIRASLAPKVSSAKLWERGAVLQPSTMHVVFSSVASLLGSPGQSNYSAANAMLDAMAAQWQAQVAIACAVCFILYMPPPHCRTDRQLAI
jgi:hypothetical protein